MPTPRKPRRIPRAEIVCHAPADGKGIVFDRETRDFALYLDGELVGFARTYQEAEATLDALVYEILVQAYGPAAAPAPCGHCGGDGCKSVLQPAFCLDCVETMLAA